jgi:hypothetical protein
MFDSGLNTLHDRDRVRNWIVVQIATWFYWHFIYPLHGLVFRDRFAKISVPRMVRLIFLIVFYVGLDLFLWIWQLYLIVIVSQDTQARRSIDVMRQAMVANRHRIIGDEWGLGFGQVTALVGVSALCYAIFLSYQGQSYFCFIIVGISRYGGRLPSQAKKRHGDGSDGYVNSRSWEF